MDASHVHWFASMLTSFRLAIETDEYVGSDARDALQCVTLIDAGYRSARAGGTELGVGASA
jgi:hypothetical protein